MAWIESHQALRFHPKTAKLARILGINRPKAVGHLHFLWWWALDFAEDGNLGKHDAEDIAEAAGWSPEDAQTFIDALIEAGFLDNTGPSGLVLHDWQDYAGRLIERRRADRQRKRQQREQNTKRLEGVRETSGGHPEDGARSHSRTLQYPTVPNHKGRKASVAHASETFFKNYKKATKREHPGVAPETRDAINKAFEGIVAELEETDQGPEVYTIIEQFFTDWQAGDLTAEDPTIWLFMRPEVWRLRAYHAGVLGPESVFDIDGKVLTCEGGELA